MNRKLAIVQESESDEKLDVDKIRKITGNDLLYERNYYQKKNYGFVPMFKLNPVNISNEPIKFEDFNNIKINCKFESKFKSNIINI